MHLRYEIKDTSQIAGARRAAESLARGLGFNAVETGQSAIVTTELATNLIKHAEGGELIFRAIEESGVSAIDILAIDRGPGIARPERSLTDGFSTAGTAGNGLGAVRRMSTLFDVYSAAGAGTIVFSRLAPARLHTSRACVMDVGAVSVPKTGEAVCGDGWAFSYTDNQSAILLADGLGHGPDAHKAAIEAIGTFLHSRLTTRSAQESLSEINDALRSTRGAAAAVATIDHHNGKLNFAGIGNISAVIISGNGSESLISNYGTLGHDVRKVQQFTYSWSPDSMLVMHSDGLLSRWKLGAHPGLASHCPAVIAAFLYRDYNRGRDDATVVVAKGAPA